MMKNKKAWLRIVEAVIAIVIIFGVLLVVISKQSSVVSVGDDVYERQSQILDVISSREDLRELILQGNEDEKIVEEVDNEIAKLVPNNWEFATKVCRLDRICSNPVDIFDKDVYVSERLITSNLTNYNPKKLKIFVWGKK